MGRPQMSAPRPPRPRLTRAQESAGGWGAAPAIRLLPAVIVAAVFMLGFRVQVVVQNMANTHMATVQLAQPAALAQAAPAGAAPNMPATPAPTPAANGAAAPAEGAPAEGAAAPPLPVNFDPSTLTKSEIDILQRLAERRDIIEQRERELVAKEGLMKAAEGRIDGKIAQLQDLEKNIKTLLQQYDVQKDAEIDQLVKIYAAMKPRDAAGIFDSLEMPILVSVVQKMSVTKSAPIMALMDRAKATALTEELTARKQISAATK
jgi:flagellar motility protein MotE (MotC chaperone)